MMKSYFEVTPDVVFDKVLELQPEVDPRFERFDDICSGRLFAEVFSPVLKACRTEGGKNRWWRWNGIIWEEDPGQTADYFAQLLSDAVWSYAGGKRLKDLDGYAVKLRGSHARATMIRDASCLPEMVLDRNQLDTMPGVLNLRNGVLLLEDFLDPAVKEPRLQLIDHNSQFMLSKVANVSFDPDASMGFFQKFIDEVCCHDMDLARHLQKYSGLCLTEYTGDHCFNILFGPTTRNGKSTFLDTLAYMLGGYAVNVEPETLAQRKPDSRTASPDLARLQGARLAVLSELSKSMSLDAALLKKLTGGDVITARMLHQNPVEFTPSFKIFMGSNFLPTVSDPTVFTSERVWVVPFNRHFKPEEQDRRLKEKLKDQEVMSGILNWALEGLRMYHKDNGLDPPEAVRKATTDYEQASDKLALFFAEECEAGKEYRVPLKSFYESYACWCRESGYIPEGRNTLAKSLTAKGILGPASINGKTVRNVIHGYRLEHPIGDPGDELPF